MLMTETKLIDGKDGKALDELCEAFLKFQELVKEYKPLQEKSYADLQAVICEHLKLESIESNGKYQTLKYLVEFKKASESETINKELLKSKYPEIYAEVTEHKISKPALKGISKIQN